MKRRWVYDPASDVLRGGGVDVRLCPGREPCQPPGRSSSFLAGRKPVLEAGVMMAGGEFFRALVLHWRWAVSVPAMARRLVLGPFRDEFDRQLCRELLVCDGDWRAACARLLDGAAPAERVLAFERFAQRTLARRPVRALLPAASA